MDDLVNYESCVYGLGVPPKGNANYAWLQHMISKLSQNGKMENMGVGGFYETIDKEFIKRNFDTTTKGGDLYKCTYRADFTSASNYGVETPTQRFAYSLKTNNDRSAPDYKHNKDFKKFISVLQKS